MTLDAQLIDYYWLKNLGNLQYENFANLQFDKIFCFINVFEMLIQHCKECRLLKYILPRLLKYILLNEEITFLRLKIHIDALHQPKNLLSSDTIFVRLFTLLAGEAQKSSL